ncbi:GNAT family N-acetyltransferase [bacterium]
MIRKAERKDVKQLTECIQNSFRDVAMRFNLNAENCPTHPSLCQDEWIENAMDKGIQYYCLEQHENIIGCVALEKAGDDLGYLERLAVVPEFRGKGYGILLIEHLFAIAKTNGLLRISVAVIAEHLELCQWYERRGFVKKEWKDYKHLPFSVQFMEVDL